MPSHIRMMARLPEPDDRGLDRQSMLRAWRFARPFRKQIFINLGTLLLATLVGLLPPLVFKWLIDHAIPQRNYGVVDLLFAASVVLAFAITGLGLLNRWYSAIIGEGLIWDLRVQLYAHVQRMPIGFFMRVQTGSLLSRLNNDVVGAQATATTASTVITDLLTLGTTLATMLVLSWRVTLLALIVVPLFVILDRKLGRKLASISRQRMVANADMTATMQERLNVSGAQLVKLFGRPEQEIADFRARSGAVRDLGIRQALTGRIYYGALSLAGALGIAIVYWLGGRSVIGGGLSVGTLVALATYVGRLYDPLTSIASARVDLLTALVSFDRCFEVLDAPLAIAESPDAIALQSPVGRVTFDHVSFRYPAPSTMTVASLEVTTTSSEHADEPSDWILRDIDLDVAPGTMVALVGASGAGKTTMSSLVPRLYDVEEGAVRIDGHDVRELTLQSVSDSIGVVSQDTHLFHDSVLANLHYAKPDATTEEIVAACRGARIHDVIAALPDGYNTVVGERGYRMSGGEKQRLAIARVLLKQPAVVILDEATAHLDSETEVLVQQALSEALQQRTALVIAHRLSTIRAADVIVVLDGGRIVERGTHTQLLADGGHYAELYQTQYAATDV